MVFYDFKMNDSKFVPFIGIGYGQTKFAVADFNYKISATNATVSVDESTLTGGATKKTKNSFLLRWGGTLGLGYQLACNTRIEVAYMIQKRSTSNSYWSIK
ncbi:MAG: hypothetical protein MRQ09_02015 [Candidatus Midichloria sp.]|nr:hypothetical protein [Candidatus Midichloria sp.]